MSLSVIVILLLLLLPSAPGFGQTDETPQEYQLKAKYVLNIPLFTEMPPQSKHNNSYTICLIGATPLESVLGSSQGKLIRNRTLKVLRVDDISQVESCQMLFIASSERHRLQVLLPEAHRRGILTISDMRNFARLGGMISLLIVDNRITFDVNRSAASKASISFSSNLLKLAHDIIN
jgi:hypothetical protein